MKKSSAVLTILLGATFMSFNGALIRLLETANGFQVLFYRSIGLSLFVLLFISWKRKISFIKVFDNIDKWDTIVGICLGFAFSCYVFSIFYTSVASTLFILSTTPIIAAFLSWLALSERPSLVVGVAMLLSLAGVLIMVKEGLSVGRSWGNGLALISAVSFAAMLVVTRRSYKTDILTGTLFGGCLSGIFGLFSSIFISQTMIVSTFDLSVMLIMGAFAIGLGISLVTLAAPFVPSAEVSILVLLESVLGPLWVWAFLNETMTGSELAGGLIILLSVCMLSYPTGWLQKNFE